MLESYVEQPCCSKEFVTQNSVEIVEKDSSLTIYNKIANETKEALIDFNDPQSLTHEIRVEIILSNSEKILFYGNYPKNEH